MNKKGFKSLMGGSNNSSPLLVSNIEPITVRVKDIILDETHPEFVNMGGWSSIGTIFYEDIKSFSLSTPLNDLNSAKPYFSNLKNYPLVNEVVVLINSTLPGNLENLSKNSQKYYLGSVNIWNNSHHNAYPNLFNEPTPNINNKATLPNNTNNNSDGNQPGINLNTSGKFKTFKELTNVNPLLPFAGDNILEGRFGNSIRIGSTVKNNKNFWSTQGSEGSPIIILRNGQHPTNISSWVNIVEDINKDNSIVCLTSTQSIPILVSNANYSALNNQPKSITRYNKPQIIFNSDRIILNSKEDSILLSSNKSISLSSNQDIGLSNNTQISLSSSSIKLGSKNANQSVILGNKFISQFEQLLISLETLCKAIEAEPLLGIAPIAATATSEIIKNIKSQLEANLSKTVKTI
jgi:hypothetical protein